MNQMTVHNDKQSLIATMAQKYEMDPAKFTETLKATVIPSNATNEQMAAFLIVANRYELDPLTREIYAFPAKGGGIQPIVSIDGWIHLANANPAFDGMDFSYQDDELGNLVSVTCRIYRTDRTRPVVITEFADECARPTEPWKQWPRRMLRHKATVQALRYAFGFAGIVDEDEAERIIHAGQMVSVQEAENGALKQLQHDARTKVAIESGSRQEPAEAPEQDEEEEEDEGPLVDQHGTPWNAEFHSANKTLSAHGTWRMRKGCDKQRYFAWLKWLKEKPEQEEEQSEGETGEAIEPGGGFTMADWSRMINDADTVDKLDQVREDLEALGQDMDEDIYEGAMQLITRKHGEFEGQQALV